MHNGLDGHDSAICVRVDGMAPFWLKSLMYLCALCAPCCCCCTLVAVAMSSSMRPFTIAPKAPPPAVATAKPLPNDKKRKWDGRWA